MLNSASPDDRLPSQGRPPQDTSLHGAQSPGTKSNHTNWHTIDFPGTVAVDQIPGTTTPNSHPNAMDSSSTDLSSSTFEPSTPEQPSQREAELLNLVRDLNECNDVLLAKVSQLEESLERSQAALQAEIDCAGGNRVGDREIVQLVTELEQSNQALQHHQLLSETLQTELTAVRDRTTQLEVEHQAILRQHTDQSQELLQANTNCRDLRARLQRQQRYTLQFKVALEKCLTMSTDAHPAAVPAAAAASSLTMPKSDQIRPWEATLGASRLDLQLESMIRGLQGRAPSGSPATNTDIAAEDQLWHDLARVMDSEQGSAPEESPERAPEHKEQDSPAEAQESPQFSAPVSFTEPPAFAEPSPFTEPSPWGTAAPSVPSTASVETASVKETASVEPDSVVAASVATADEKTGVETTLMATQLSPQASEILARVQSAQAGIVGDTYLPALSTQSNPSPLVKPLRPQKRIGSLSAIDLPNFPRLKKPSPAPKA